MELENVQRNYSVGLIDAHVHLYDCFDINIVLDSAWNNLQEVVQRFEVGGDYIGVFFLTETSSDHKFQFLQKVAAKQQDGEPWKFYPTKETCSLLAIGRENQLLVLVAGRQIVTKENLEVLALGTTQFFKDLLPIDEVLRLIQKTSALAVLPWGVGKWLGKRGRIVESVLDSNQHPEVFLGDNSGRLGLMPFPRLLAKAVGENRKVLPGSDPLPFTREMNKPGSFGCILEQPISRDTPARDIKNALVEPNVSIIPFGQAESLFRFIHNQIAMQLRKYTG